MRKRGAVLVIVLLSIFAAGVVVSKVLSDIEAKYNLLVDTPIRDIDLSKIGDGTYYGNYKAFPVTVEVRVTVAGHRILRIEVLRHVNGMGSSAEKIIDGVVGMQSLKVDVISGATYSSLVILKAIENALLGEVG